MIIPDVNLLLYAVITGFPQHRAARDWFEAALNDPTPMALTSPAIFGFLRLCTNARVLESPLPVDLTTGYVRDWLAQPAVELLRPGPGHLEIAFELLTGIGTASNLTTDVQPAAYAIEFDGELHSNGADFARFPKLRWVNPIQA